MGSLLFIDTNILLDFYRARGDDLSLKILDHLDGNHDRIITTAEVEMEYKKNRQRVIIDSLSSIKVPESGVIVPSFLQESSTNKSIKTAAKQMNAQSKRIKERTAKLLKDPGRNDPVYRALQRLFKAGGEFHLTRDKKMRHQIREDARKRFELGYPPRKKDDTSFGDAINWEWIIHCAKQSGQDIVIVSRDSDYGITYGGVSTLNDWLRQEFKERVSQKRSIVLVSRLTEGLKHIEIQVTPAEEQSEQRFVKNLRQMVLPSISQEQLDEITRLLDNLEVKYRQFLKDRVYQSSFPSESSENHTIQDVGTESTDDLPWSRPLQG